MIDINHLKNLLIFIKFLKIYENTKDIDNVKE